jgi:hypothetical protein
MQPLRTAVRCNIDIKAFRQSLTLLTQALGIRAVQQRLKGASDAFSDFSFIAQQSPP